MIWSPSIAKKLDEAVPPFEDTPRDWNDVLARGTERTPRILFGRRRLMLGTAFAAIVAVTLSLVVTLASVRSSAAPAPSPPEIWKAVAASPSFADNAEVLGIQGEFSESNGDPYGELTVTVNTSAVRSSGAFDDPRVINTGRANWLALMAAATYENEALQAGRSGLHVVTTKVESENPDGSVEVSSESNSVDVSGVSQPIVAPGDLSSAKERVLTRGRNLPNVKSLDVSLLSFGGSAAVETRVVVDDVNIAYSSTVNALSRILGDEFANSLIGSELEVENGEGDLLLYWSGSSLFNRGTVIAFQTSVAPLELGSLAPGLFPWPPTR